MTCKFKKYVFYLDPTSAEMEKSFVLAENYLVKLLKKSCSCQNFNELRYWEYHHGSSFSIQNLPATSASIRLHILRAWYITYKQLLKSTQLFLSGALEFY